VCEERRKGGAKGDLEGIGGGAVAGGVAAHPRDKGLEGKTSFLRVRDMERKDGVKSGGKKIQGIFLSKFVLVTTSQGSSTGAPARQPIFDVRGGRNPAALF